MHRSYNPSMSIETIIAQLDAEIARLTMAKVLLSESTTIAPIVRRGRPRKTGVVTPAKPIKRRKNGITPEGRARIGAAAKRRWAAQKAKAK
jgi:hypothetical protein